MKIEFTTSGAAFCDPFTGDKNDYYKTNACIDILESIADKIREGYTRGSIMDINGNKIGSWEI